MIRNAKEVDGWPTINSAHPEIGIISAEALKFSPHDSNRRVTIKASFILIFSSFSKLLWTRETSTQVAVTFEIPRSVITKTIVNAVSHRNYRHNGFVQVIVFADRVEVWNPGELPPGLTPDLLRKPHGPIPRNPLIAEPLFRVKSVEKTGTGTTDMIVDCRKAELPEPDFEQRGPHFVVTLWRDWLTDEVLAGYNLSDRQKHVIKHVKVSGRINNAQYRDLTGISARTALRELRQLTDLGIFAKVGGTGQSAHYVITKARPVIGKRGGNRS